MQKNDIKTKNKDIIKTIDKSIVRAQKLKNNFSASTSTNNKDNTNNNAENYAEEKIQRATKNVSQIGLRKFNELGRKSIKETGQNYTKIKNRIKNTSKNSIKNYQNTSKFAKKGIKTSGKIVKNTGKAAKESIKMSKRVIKVARETAKATAKTIKATIESIKAVIAGTKALISLILAGGWIAVVIVLIIVLLGGFMSIVFNGTDDDKYDTSQIPNSQIVFVAKAQIGNEGGDKFWKWYGFKEHVHWCACYVSWCANECGYIEKGIIPKFASCNEGIRWFKERNQWHDRSDGYYPMVGDIIFFDWYDNNGNLSGSADHVGIVTKIDINNKTIYTIEGNTGNKCAERMYSFDDKQVMGYGSPKY